MNNRRYPLFLISLLSFCASAKTWDKDNFKNLYANFGSWQEYYMQVQDTKSGELNGFELTPYFSAGIDYHFNDRHLIIPEIGYVLRRNLSDGNVTKDHLFMRLDYAYQFVPWFRARIGSSLMWITMTGNGKEKTMPNGSGTETYYAPSERKNIFNQTLDFGVEFIQDKLSARLHAYIYAPNEQDESLTSYSLSLNYIFPIEDL